jgi:cytochrome b561
MVQIRNTEYRYGFVAIVLHWVMAALLIGLVALGFYMVSLPDVGFDTRKLILILYHKELGVLAFLLAMVRLAWRVTNVLPELVETLPDWQKIAARFVHLSFYGLIFALPMTGWTMSSAAAIPVFFVGIMLPDLVPHDDYLFHAFMAIHKWLGYALTILIFIHVGAALRHHFLLKDATLRKMLPFVR